MSEWEILGFGLLLGIRHAFDADHLVAVTTIVREYRNPLRAIWVGVSWGLGHTTTLLLAGVILLLLKIQMPEKLALGFEFAVGIMLVLLGIQAFLSFRRSRIHAHPHEHENEKEDAHEHFHVHSKGAEEHTHSHISRLDKASQMLIAGIAPGEGEGEPEGIKKSLKPFFRIKSYLVGIVHGLAGSAALMLVVLASIESAFTGATYILLFGLGTVISMGLISTLISLPFAISKKIPVLNRVIQMLAGIISIYFGLMLMYEIGIVEGLFRGG